MHAVRAARAGCRMGGGPPRAAGALRQTGCGGIQPRQAPCAQYGAARGAKSGRGSISVDAARGGDRAGQGVRGAPGYSRARFQEIERSRNRNRPRLSPCGGTPGAPELSSWADALEPACSEQRHPSEQDLRQRHVRYPEPNADPALISTRKNSIGAFAGITAHPSAGSPVDPAGISRPVV